jgi:membrane protein involved in colicin uptake
MSSNSLPTDYPHREVLIAGGVVTRAQVRAAGDAKLARLPNLGLAGVKELRAYETAHPEEELTSAAEEAARQAADVEAKRRAEEETKRKAEEEAVRQRAEQEAKRKAEEESARKAAEAARRREEEERERIQRPRRVRVLVDNLGPNRLKKDEVTDDAKAVALLDKPYGYKLVEEVE